ncbi:BRCT domain-containing protein [Streptococcus sobrinus]|uniref:BRCT domain-containing protein n=1 Tax=Streptococcus sobrinus TaxID=1310 RepID=UPI00031E8158|nr:BRCT domain-containing protein [Streptococcus sobrinus]
MGVFQNQVVAITGSLRPVTRDQAIHFIQDQGGTYQSFVSDRTTLLIAGHKQLDLFNPDNRSLKYQAAKTRQASGQALTIIGEDDFFSLMKSLR